MDPDMASKAASLIQEHGGDIPGLAQLQGGDFMAKATELMSGDGIAQKAQALLGDSPMGGFLSTALGFLGMGGGAAAAKAAPASDDQSTPSN